MGLVSAHLKLLFLNFELSQSFIYVLEGRRAIV